MTSQSKSGVEDAALHGLTNIGVELVPVLLLINSLGLQTSSPQLAQRLIPMLLGGDIVDDDTFDLPPDSITRIRLYHHRS